MSETATTSVLERKLAVGREDARGGERSALRALRLALARVAEELFELPMAVIGAKQARCDHDGAGTYLFDDQLLVLLDGVDGLAGAVSLDGACVAALTQQQTIGRVTGTAMAERAFTGTDAALAESLIQQMLARAADLVEMPADRQCLKGFRFGARVEDVRTLMLTLEADKFRVFDLTVDIAEGVMQGKICLMMPEKVAVESKGANGGAKAVQPGPRLEQAFDVMRADLTAVVCRIRLPLTELAEMRPGDVIPLMRERLEVTELVSINGRAVATGRLGQINGLRALRLNETGMPAGGGDVPMLNSFAEHVVQAETDDTAMMRIADASGVQDSGPEDTLGSGVPALIDSHSMVKSESEEEDDELGALLERMTPEEAAAEISQLAGLKPEDIDGGDVA